MKSVTQRIKEIKQPTGGYLNPKCFEVIELEDGNVLNEEENINPGIIGMVVDYMTRYMISKDRNSAFRISIWGAQIIKDIDKANILLGDIKGLDDNSIINACKLCGYDVCFRAGSEYYKNVDDINPDDNTISNIRCMVNRSISFFEKYGPIAKDGITFMGGYTSTISSGDADFLTQDTLWDFKVSKNNLTKEQTLQLLIYYILGLHSYECDFSTIKALGIFNPRKNIVYKIETYKISDETIKIIEKEVIGYGKDSTESLNIEVNNIQDEKMTINDVMKYLQCSRHMVMKYYSEYDLPLQKEKNRYIVYKKQLFLWVEEMKERRKEEREQLLMAISIIIFSILIPILFMIFIN